MAELIVIAHRGASGYLPEHTLEAYALAHGMGADYIEPDLVLTKDGVFICLHDIHLEATTDVEEVFPHRKRDDGRWYAADFSVEEIKRLGAHERLEKRFPVGDSRFEVPTFEEMIELVQGLNRTTGRRVGIYPELKAPSFHEKEGMPMEGAFVELVTQYGYVGPDAKIFVQCFEAAPLKKLRFELKSELPLIQLVGNNSSGRAMVRDTGLDEIATYANGIGPAKTLLERDDSLVRRAHARGLAVHPYTFRADSVPAKYESFQAEVTEFVAAYRVDGLFTDFPDVVEKILSSTKSMGGKKSVRQ